MNINKIDLNLLIYLDVLLRESNVTRAASKLHITQPAMSNGLKRLRDLLNDPLLVRTNEGMKPTEKALRLQPIVRKVLLELEEALQPEADFNEQTSTRVFRIMASDYAASTVIPRLLNKLRENAPGITLDIMTPSDVTIHDVESGKIDMAINRFEELPQSIHQKSIWQDDFVCMMSTDNTVKNNFNLENYLQSQHIWVSKTGFGIGVGVDPNDVQKLGWVDEALQSIHKKRSIRVFTRSYHTAMHLALEQDLIATLPRKVAMINRNNPDLVILEPPFKISTIDLKMIWSSLLHHDASHIWFRRQVMEVANELKETTLI
ncbi:MAG: LysR family transcriptional regulator [Marinomonas sp.]